MSVKKFTLIVLSTALIAGIGNAEARKIGRIAKKGAPARVEAPSKKHDAGKLKAKAENAAAIWRASTTKTFGWDETEWVPDETYSMKYDNKGLVTEQESVDAEGLMSLETYTWNENGNLSTRFSKIKESVDGEYVNSQRLSREYDNVVTSFITFNNQDVWSDDAWQPSNNYKQTVTRDANGNVTLMERAVYFEGIYDPTYRLVVTYGEDGKASRIEEHNLDYDYDSDDYVWILSYVYDNIEWETTDGQILSTDNLLGGSNKIKSATLTDEDGFEINFEVEYQGEDYIQTYNYYDEDYEEQVYVKTTYSELDFSNEPDSHGQYGYRYYSEVKFVGDDYEEEQAEIEEGIYDENDLIILEQYTVVFDGEEYVEDLREGQVEYDDEYGYPLVWTVKELDFWEEELLNAFRCEYSDYIDATSKVDGIIVADNTPAIYYNLQGQRVANPSAGLYIRVKGDKSEKVILK